MKPGIVQTLRSRWFAACVHASLWLLLYLAVTHLGGKAPPLREGDSFSPPQQSLAPVAKLDSLFSPGVWPKPLADTNALDPFFTRYFTPPPTPAPPPPPPPTTRKIELTYLGYYQTTNGPKHVVVKLSDALLVSAVGGRLASNLYVAQVTMQTLMLTNPAAQTNLLNVNVKKEIEVPIR